MVGFNQVVGYLDGGMDGWREAGLPVEQLEQMSIDELHEIYQGQMILDVRDQSEWDEGHIKGAKHIPYYFLEERYQELDSSQPLAVICAGGQRSTIACAILQKHGFTQLLNVLGGMDTWNRVGFETVKK